MYFSVPQVGFLCAQKSHCRTEMWLQEVGLFWSLSEHLLLVMMHLLMSKTKQGFVWFLEEGVSHIMKIHKHSVHRIQPSSPCHSGINQSTIFLSTQLSTKDGSISHLPIISFLFIFLWMFLVSFTSEATLCLWLGLTRLLHI